MVAFKQDMPPAGGYAPIIYQRVPLKPGWNIHLKVAIFFVITGVGGYLFNLTKKKLAHERIEMRCGRLALAPMLYAEVDRMVLKQLKRNRDAEEEIMKDVEGWEVGKWKGLPVFNTVGPNEYFKPIPDEYYAHTESIEFTGPRELMKNH